MKSTETFTTASSHESCQMSAKVDLSGDDRVAAAVARHDSIEKTVNTQVQNHFDAGHGTLQRNRPTNERRGNRPKNMVDIPRFTWTTPAAKELISRLDKIARLDSTALLTGESGTGKTTVARMIHERSRRNDRSFIAVNCASLPSELMDAELFGHARGSFTGAVSDRPGRVEAADGGTLFLDEIGDLPLGLQPKLLTFLQERTFYRIGDNQPRFVDVRIIAATHRDLRDMCRQGKFREDLYFRLNVLGLAVPPLRERPNEIINMAAEILDRIRRQRHSAPIELNPAAVEALKQYHWPGNVRELENVLENASAFCEDHQIRVSDLNLTESPCAKHTSTPSLAGKALAAIEKQAILETLKHCDGNKAQAARDLGISEKSIYNKLRRHGLYPR